MVYAQKYMRNVEGSGKLAGEGLLGRTPPLAALDRARLHSRLCRAV